MVQPMQAPRPVVATAIDEAIDLTDFSESEKSASLSSSPALDSASNSTENEGLPDNQVF